MSILLKQPPSLAKIYLRGALGFITKKHSLGPEVTRINPATTIPDETLKFQIDPGHVEKFNMVMNSTASTTPTTTTTSSQKVPLAYPQCLINGMPMNLMTHKFFPLNIVGSVHEATEITSHKPIPLLSSDPPLLNAQCHLQPEIAHSDKMDWIFTVVTTICNDHDDEPVMTITNQYRVLNPKRNQVKKTTNGSSSNGGSNNIDIDDDWQLLATWNFPVDTGRRYALLNGDINPIHLFPLTAKLFGYKSCIAHGMYSVCQLLHDPQLASATQVTARFTRPTLLPSPVVQAYWKPGGEDHESEYVIGTRSPTDGIFKETVKGSIQMG